MVFLFRKKKIGNLAYMSILANGSLNAIRGIKNNFVRLVLKLFFSPISSFERFKLKKKWYGFAPELDIARYLRKKFFIAIIKDRVDNLAITKLNHE